MKVSNESFYSLKQSGKTKGLLTFMRSSIAGKINCVRGFGLSKADFIPLYCAILWPPLGFAMEANSPNLWKWFSALQQWLVRDLHHVPYEERLYQPNLFSLELRRLILAFKVPKGVIDLSPSDFPLRPPRAGLRGHTYRILQGPSRLR